jgi:RNA polymerase sigma-32 factor
MSTKTRKPKTSVKLAHRTSPRSKKVIVLPSTKSAQRPESDLILSTEAPDTTSAVSNAEESVEDDDESDLPFLTEHPLDSPETAPEDTSTDAAALYTAENSADAAQSHTPEDPTEELAIPPSPHQDPLRRYMNDIKQYSLLDSPEEFDLAIRLRDQGDLSAAKALVTANLRLVVKIAFEYRTFYSNLLDLIQEGNIGLMKAVSKFDPTKGVRLGYYASWWIRSYILKYLLDNFRLVKVGTTQAQKKLFYHLMREKERLEAQGLLAGPKLLAEKLNVREKDVVEMEQRLSGQGVELSLNTPTHADEGGKAPSHLEFLADPAERADDALARNQLLQVLKTQLPHFQQNLNEKELLLLKERILSDEPKTLQEIADLYGLTRERARQIESKVIEKLRDYLKKKISFT